MKKVYILLLLMLVIILPVKASELVDDYLDIAANYKNIGNYTKTLEYVNYVLMLDPKNPKAVKIKGQILPHEANNEKLETATILSNTEDISKLTIIDVPVSSGNIKTTFNSEYYNKQGKKHYLNKDYDEAAQCFYKAVTLDSKNYIAYNNLAMAHWMKNNLDYAEKYLHKASAMNNKYTQPLLNLAILYKQQGKMDKHYLYLMKVIKNNPNNYWAYYLLGDYYSSLECYNEAVKNYIESIKINPNFAPPYLALAVAYFKTDKNEASIFATENYLTLCPESDFAYSILAKNYQVRGKYAEAQKYIDRALELNNSNYYRMELAKIQYNLTDYRTALINFQILLPDFDYADTYNYIGLCNYMLKNYEAAIANFNKAIVLDGHRPIYFYNLAQCYKEMDNKRSYAQYMNTALQILPLTYQDYIDLSCIYYSNSNSSLAMSTLEIGINNFPDSKQLYLTKLNLYNLLNDKVNYTKLKQIIDERFNTDAKKSSKFLFK